MKSRDRMYESVQYGRVYIECKIIHSMEEEREIVRLSTVRKSRDRIYDSVQYGRVNIDYDSAYYGREDIERQIAYNMEE